MSDPRVESYDLLNRKGGDEVFEDEKLVDKSSEGKKGREIDQLLVAGATRQIL